MWLHRHRNACVTVVNTCVRSEARLVVALSLLILGATMTGCAVSPPSGPGSSGVSTPANQAPEATATLTPTPTLNPLILAPAATPSSVGICTQQMTFGGDGNASPILCSDGAVNTLAWTYFDQMYPDFFPIGAYATESQVQQAVSQLSPPIPAEESAYCLAKAYYNWQFAVPMDPANQTGVSASCAQDIPNFP